MLTAKKKPLILFWFIILCICWFVTFICPALPSSSVDYTYLLKPHFQFIDLPEEKTKKDSQYLYKSPRSRQAILQQFCQIKRDKQKQSYLNTLDDIVKNGKNFQKRTNYNDETERANKRADENDPKIYNIATEPHSEAAYHLGVIYAFSQCGMQNKTQAIEYFQQAYNKPETYFMIAEFYRTYYPNTKQRQIAYLYNNAINSGITEAHYNLALYMYQMINLKTDKNIQNPQDFTYKNILKHLRLGAISNQMAQNDFAIMLHKTKPNIPPVKLYFLMNLYFAKAAAQGFEFADYNQIIIMLSQKCTVDNQKLLKQKLTHLKEKQSPLLPPLLPIVKRYGCVDEER